MLRLLEQFVRQNKHYGDIAMGICRHAVMLLRFMLNAGFHKQSQI